MVVDANERFPELAHQLDKIDGATRREHNVYLDAQALSERLFGDHMMTNTLALGAAYQRGALPVSREALEEAIRLNGAAVEKNLAAFAWGRAVVAAPGRGGAGDRSRRSRSCRCASCPRRERELVDLAVDGDRDELRRLVEVRVPELVAYQDEDYARRYAEAVRRVHVAEQERTPGHSELTEAVARQLFKLMAYKDEYEVARLHLDAVEQAKLQRRVRRGREGLVQPPPADAARAGDGAQAQAGPLVRARRSGAVPRCAACAARGSTRSGTPRCAASSAS